MKIKKIYTGAADPSRRNFLKNTGAFAAMVAASPGSVFSLGSPGLFEMLVAIGEKKERVISSVDAVADKKSKTLEKAHELFAMLRGVGPEMCGARTFYGIERRSL